MELAWLLDFTELARSRNFSRAAETRHVTQPAFSRRISALERWVGTPLFVRTQQGAMLTPAGDVFFREAPAIHRSLTALRREAREAGRRESSRLVFAATHALSFSFFPGWLRQIERHTETGPVELLSDSMQACEELMRDGRAQFLICHRHDDAPTRLDGPHFEAITIGHDALIPYAACAADRRPRWNLDCAREPVPTLGYAVESGLSRILAARGFEARGVDLQRVFSARLAATLLGMVRQGEGVAWLPRRLAEQDERNGTLARAGGDTWKVDIDVRLYRPSAALSPAAEALWRIAREPEALKVNVTDGSDRPHAVGSLV